jgi:hypothetical protein
MKNKLKMTCFVSLKIKPSMEVAAAHGGTVMTHAGA